MLASRPTRPRRRSACALRAAHALAALVFLSLLAAPPPPAHAAEVRIAVGDRTVHALLADGIERGLLEREGVQATVQAVDDPAAAVADGDADLAAVTADALIEAERLGEPLRGALLLAYALESDALVAASRVGGIAGLRGATVGLRGTGEDSLLLVYALQRTGLSMDDVRTVRLAPGASARGLAAALADGTLDAAVLHGPVVASLLERNADAEAAQRVRVLASAADSPGLVTDLLVGEDRWLSGNREAVKSVVRGWNRIVAAARRNPTETAARIAERLGAAASADGAAGALDGLQLLDVQDNVELVRGEYQSAFSDMSEVLERRDRVNARGVPSANRFLSLSALRQVAAGR